ncbi:hypothetical protein KSS87_006544 [Heliosperma pusillum]|nr:hypothetical protein KSS87_006544 [Heliosperma pusillum]
MMAGNPSWWSMQSELRSTSDQQHHHHHHEQEANNLFISQTHPSINNNSLLPVHQQYIHGSSSTSPSSSLMPFISLVDHHHAQDFPHSWSQLLLGGMANEQEEERYSTAPPSHFQSTRVINDVKPEVNTPSNNSNNNLYENQYHHEEQQQEGSSCNSTATGGLPKKPRLQSSSNPPLKVRKEKLGDRITSLHQLVSPFGKTDTASVLLEAIGYIRFLQGQIEALSSPYLGSNTSSVNSTHSVHGERTCLFPDHPGQLLNDSCLKRRGAANQEIIGSENGADYWAQSLGGGY